jgi:hypothetical protein
MTCWQCGQEKDSGNRLPRGWKRDPSGSPLCKTCTAGRYLLRSITLPVAEPLSGSWTEFESAMKTLWVQTTAATNFIYTELYARDVRRLGQPKMPAMPKTYLYSEIRTRFPDLPPQACASLENAIQAKYRAKRYEIIWLASSSLPTARYPQPFPVHNKAWSLSFDRGNRPVVSLRLDNRRWDLRLRGGARYFRQIAALERLVNGEAMPGEAAIYKTAGGHVLCKLVMRLPRGEAVSGSGTLLVKTCADKLLAAVNPSGDPIWTYNGDHIRRWIAEYDRKRRRLAEDQKAEHHPVPPFGARRDAMTNKQHNRMSSAVKEIAAHLVQFAERRKIATVEYDDSERGFVPAFPYFQLANRIEAGLDAVGISFSKLTDRPHQQPAKAVSGALRE